VPQDENAHDCGRALAGRRIRFGRRHMSEPVTLPERRQRQRIGAVCSAFRISRALHRWQPCAECVNDSPYVESTLTGQPHHEQTVAATTD
jgi:hypothetical protein